MTYFLPLGDNQTASSRLRVYLIAPYLNATIGCPDRYEKGDVLIIQKVHAPDELRKAKSQGAKVIFDIDDPYLYKHTYQSMAEKADLVTVDTEARKAYAEQYTNKPVVVVPDALDWDGVTRGYDVKNGIAGWTGYGNNAAFLEGMVFPYKLRLISTVDCGKFYSGDFEFSQWDLDTVDEEIRQCEFMINRLPLNETTAQKGMHKLLKSWANGVPCYTSRIPDYVKAMEEAGVGEKYLVDDWANMKNEGFDERCRSYAMKYRAEDVAKKWKEVIKSL